MTDTYEFLKEQKEAIIASQKDKRHEFANDVIRRHERIREAAPMLLNELKQVMSWIDNWSPEFANDPDWPTDRDNARAAIAAATGEQA